MSSPSCIVESAGHFINVEIDELPSLAESGRFVDSATVWVGSRSFPLERAVSLARQGKLAGFVKTGTDDGTDQGGFDPTVLWSAEIFAKFVRPVLIVLILTGLVLVKNCCFQDSPVQDKSDVAESAVSPSLPPDDVSDDAESEFKSEFLAIDDAPVDVDQNAASGPGAEAPTPGAGTESRRTGRERSSMGFGGPYPSSFGVRPVPAVPDAPAVPGVPGAPGAPDADPQTPRENYALEPFDPSVTKIDPAYLGHDLGAVVACLKKDVFAMPDPELETSEAVYRRKLDKQYDSLQNEPLFGTTNFGSRLAYVLPNRSEESSLDISRFLTQSLVYCRYDARDKTMIVQGETQTYESSSWDRGLFQPPLGAQFPLYVSSRPTMETYALALDLRPVRRQAVRYFATWFVVGVEPDEYARIRNSIRVLCVFSLGPGGNGTLGLFTRPDPTFAVNELYASAGEFWIYNGETGDVYAKYSAADMCRGVKKAFGKPEKGSVAYGVGRSSQAGAADEGVEEPVESEDASEAAASTQKVGQTAESAWNDAFEPVKDVLEDWETREADVTIPDDCATLVEAVKACPSGGVIRISPTDDAPVRLGRVPSRRDDYPGLALDKPVAIVGSPTDPSSVVIELDGAESVWARSPDGVKISGVTFRYSRKDDSKAARPETNVVEGGVATLRNCVFTGGSAERSTSYVVVAGEYASATIERCSFSGCMEDAIRFVNGAKGRVEFCRFGPDNACGVSALDGATAEIRKSLFVANGVGVRGSGGGGFSLSDSFFSGNRREWSVSSGSREFCDTKKNNLIEKREKQTGAPLLNQN